MARECSLCGGKLRGNICTECGLDNSKNDASYRTTRSHKWNTELTHVHEKSDPLAGKTMTGKQQEELKAAIKERRSGQKKSSTVTAQRMQADSSGCESGSYEYGGAVGNGTFHAVRKEKKNRSGVIFWIALLIFALVMMFYEGSDDYYEDDYEYEDEWDDAYDPYEETTYELEETGEEYEITLTAGTYVGGVHLPEGVYSVEWVSGEGRLKMECTEQQIYITTTKDDLDEEDSILEDFRVYEGARIEVEEDARLRFYTENARLPMEEMIKNPQKEGTVVEDAFTVGEEVEAGIYDVYCENGSGIFNYTVELEDGYSTYEGKLIGDGNSKFPALYRNVVLPEGVEVEIEGMRVRLVPSEYVWDVDYDSFYE